MDRSTVAKDSLMTDREKLLQGWGMTTARFFYRMPDHRSVLQEFLWQFDDLAPDFPALRDKIEFWKREIDGPLHSVAFAHRRLIRPGEWRRVDGEFLIN